MMSFLGYGYGNGMGRKATNGCEIGYKAQIVKVGLIQFLVKPWKKNEFYQEGRIYRGTDFRNFLRDVLVEEKEIT